MPEMITKAPAQTDTIAALELHAAIIGQSGEGKSYLARGFVERLLMIKRQVVIIDPTGVWWGLRSGVGGSAGCKIAIFGGSRGDVQIAASSGAQLGALLGTQALSAIVDVSEFDTAEDQIRFVTDFLRAMYGVNRKPVHLIVDEADEFAPEVRTVEGASGCLDQMARIVKRGRVRGFRMLMITQRPADVSKRVLAAAKALFLKKVALKLDHTAVNGWVGSNCTKELAGEVMASLGSLKRDEAWIVAPGSVVARRPVPKITTFDSMKAPEEGDAPPPVDLVDVDAATLAALLADAPTGTPAPAEGPPVIRQGPTEAEIRAQVARVQAEARAEGIKIGRQQVRDALQALLRTEGEPNTQAPVQTPRPTVTAPGPKPIKQRLPLPPPVSFDAREDPLLQVARSVWPAKLSWAQLAAACGRKARGGHFNMSRRRLIDQGHVVEEGGLVRPTNPPEKPTANVVDLLEQNLPQPAQKIFAWLRAEGPAHTGDIGEALGMKTHGGHWNSGMAVLRNNELIEQDAHDAWRIADRLRAPEGARAHS